MGYIAVVLASLVVGVVVGYQNDGSTLATQVNRIVTVHPGNGLPHDIQPRINLDLASRHLNGLRSAKAGSRSSILQGLSGENPLSRSTLAETSVVNDDTRPLLLPRVPGTSSSPSISEASSESWSGASKGTKRKVNQQLLQHDMTWGQSKAQEESTNKASTTSKSKSLEPWGLEPSKKRLRISVKGTSSSSKDPTPRSKTATRDRNRSGSDLIGRVSDLKQSQTMSASHESFGRDSRTAEQKARKKQWQQDARQEQKRKVQAGDPAAIQKQINANTRRRELEHKRRADIGNPISTLPPKLSAKDRKLARAKSARYRARQKGDLPPVVFTTSPEERKRSRDKMRRRRAQQRGNSPEPDISEASARSSTSESEWKSSSRSDSATSSPAVSDNSANQGRRAPARRTPLPTQTRGGDVLGSDANTMKLDSNGQKADSNGAQNNPEVTSLATQGRNNPGSPTTSQRHLQNSLAQSVQVLSPNRSPNPVPSPGRQENSLLGYRPLGSPGYLSDPFPDLPHEQLLAPTMAQPLQGLADPLSWTPPLSPLSLGSLRSWELTRPSSPNSKKS